MTGYNAVLTVGGDTTAYTLLNSTVLKFADATTSATNAMWKIAYTADNAISSFSSAFCDSADIMYKNISLRYMIPTSVLTTGTFSNNDCTTYWNAIQHTPINPKERLRELLRERRGPGVIIKSRISHPADIREVRARQTLRMIVGDKEYRRFLKRGFVLAKNNTSGRVYQIFPNHEFIRVYENSKLICQLCIYLKGDFTLSDTVITKYLLALNDEDRLWRSANRHAAPLHRPPARRLEKPFEPAQIIWNRLKSHA